MNYLCRRCRKPCGFTLVELLVVIGVIVIVIGLLLPSVSAARRAAGQAECAANLRQWAIAVIEYAQDNDAWLPRRGQGIEPTQQITWYDDWFNELPPYLKQPSYQNLVAAGAMPQIGDKTIWMCPEAYGLPNQYGNLFGYAMNMALSVRNAPQPDRIDRVGKASTMAFMADGAVGYCSVLPTAPAAGTEPYNPVARHNGHVNIVFLDSHVQAFTAAYVANSVGAGATSAELGVSDLRWYWYIPGPSPAPWPGP
jgi:prepilin-type N-terminal cleavage/methylation domain-containing protein/prepilin-type processing-associated H-X9-DG protein